MHRSSREPLISASEVLATLGDPGVRVADVRWFLGEPDRGAIEYRQSHIPGAVFVDLDRDLAAAAGPGRHPLPEPTAFADRLGELGIGDQHTVVVHDAANGQYGARLWWMLDRLGHRDVVVLDGGLAAWHAVDGPMTAERTTHLRASMTLASEWSHTTDLESLVAHKDEVDLVDVRAAERYSGEEEPMEAIAGHILGARSRPCASLMDKHGRMLPAATVRPLMRGEGERAQLPLVISCGSGVTACYGALAARFAGLPDPVIYPGSFSDWVARDMPVVTGTEPDGPIAG